MFWEWFLFVVVVFFDNRAQENHEEENYMMCIKTGIVEFTHEFTPPGIGDVWLLLEIGGVRA